MKKHLSILYLLIRSTFLPLLAVWGLVFALQSAYFLALLSRQPLHSPEIIINRPLFQNLPGPAAVPIPFLSALGLILTMVLLCFSLSDLSSYRTSYTIRRLSLSERSIYLWQMLYNTACVFLYWAAQSVTMLLLMQVFLLKAGSDASAQSLFLACHRSPFLHSLFPMEDWSLMLRNCVMALSLGIVSAHYPMNQRRENRSWFLPCSTLMIIVNFSRGLENNGDDLFYIVSLIVCTFACVLYAINLTEGGRAYEESQKR